MLEFSEVYADHKEQVWKLISRYVYSPEDREDLFQEIFLKIHRALPGFRGQAQTGTWIYRITVNSALNYLKRLKKNKMIYSLLHQFKLVDEATVEIFFGDGHLARPLGQLNPRQRMVLILSDVEERPLEDISRILRIPVGTVKSNLFRARELVRKELMKNE